MIERPLPDLTLDDVLELREEVQQETHTHELKGAIDFRYDKHKAMLAVQVCSFANARGGDLILGVHEEPSRVLGLEGAPDDLELRVREIARARIDPKPPTLQIRAIRCEDNRHVYVVRVPRSWTAPHMLTQEHRFYTRDGNGKRPMDRYEIERAFQEATGREDEIRRFRRERVSVLREEANSVFRNPRLMVVHLVPLQPASMPVGETAFKHLLSQASLDGHHIFESSRTTLDGLELSSSWHGEKSLEARATVYRNGRLEYVWSLNSRMELTHKEGCKVVYLGALEMDLGQSLRGLLAGLVEYGVEPPVCVMVTLFGLKGFISWDRANAMTFHTDHVPRYACDRDELIFPPVTLESDIWAEYTGMVSATCRVLWQCFGETWGNPA